MHTSLINMFHTGKMMQHHPSSLELYGLAPLLSTFSPRLAQFTLFIAKICPGVRRPGVDLIKLFWRKFPCTVCKLDYFVT